jgi:lipoyl(octanoyl) transferase
MRAFTTARTAASQDEIWLLEHESVYTLGLAGDLSHILNPAGIPVVKTDRGGQVTWHGPGQLIAYVMMDLRRLGLGPRELVSALEDAIIQTLRHFGVAGERRARAPGVYVEGAKIAALGLRIRGGSSYHGLALNVNPDLTAFGGINPCGYAGLAVTSLATLGLSLTLAAVGPVLVAALQDRFYGGAAHRIMNPTLMPPAG